MSQPLSPPTLVGLPQDASAAGGFAFATIAIWILVALAIAAIGAIVVVAIRWITAGRARSASSSAVLITMCNGLKLTKADRRLLKQLAQESSGTSPVSLLLCPSVFERAAAKAASKVDKQALHRLRQRLAA